MAMRQARGLSRPTAPRSAAKPRPAVIGPGRLILVLGPSGAGKDTLIGGARAAAGGDPRLVFPRRVVTRPASDAEDHETMDARTFERAVARGGFALWWRAHGNGYGIRSSMDDDIRLGRTVVCNVSRTIVGVARERYSWVTVAAVTAPQQVLRSRLASRQRSTDGEIARRLERSTQVDHLFEADFVIRNVGRPEAGIRRLLNIIRNVARPARSNAPGRKPGKGSNDG